MAAAAAAVEFDYCYRLVFVVVVAAERSAEMMKKRMSSILD